MYDFDILAKKCKLYYLKKVLYTVIPLLIIAGGALFLFLENTTPKQKTAPAVVKRVNVVKKTKEPAVKKESIKRQEKRVLLTKIKKETPVSSHKTKTYQVKNDKANYCYALQFFVSKKSKTRYAYLNKEKLTQLGFDCFIYEGTELLHLVCNQTSDYSEFLKAKELANHYNLHYVSKKRLCDVEKPKDKKRDDKKSNEVKQKQKEEQQEALEPKNRFVLQSATYDLKKLKELFSERKSYTLALKIAQKYYKKQNYDKVIEWAKRANSINKQDDASWILYAQALYAQHNYKKAKKILEIYTKFENSPRVMKLLSDWSDK